MPRRFSSRATAAAENIRLVAGRLRGSEPAGFDEMWKQVQLLQQVAVEMPPGLIIRKGTMPVSRRIERVPAHDDGARTFRLIKPDEIIGKADDGARAAAARPLYGLWQPMIGTVSERISIDDQQRPAGGSRLDTLAC